MPGVALNLNSTDLHRAWSPRESTPRREIPTVEPRIEPGTSSLVGKVSDHWTTRLVLQHHFQYIFREEESRVST